MIVSPPTVTCTYCTCRVGPSVEMLLQQTYSAKPHTDPPNLDLPPLEGRSYPVHTGALGGVGVNVSKVAEVKEGAG